MILKLKAVLGFFDSQRHTVEQSVKKIRGKPPDLVVNSEDSPSEPWSPDKRSNPGFA
jgi:hypothetical protein